MWPLWNYHIFINVNEFSRLISASLVYCGNCHRGSNTSINMPWLLGWWKTTNHRWNYRHLMGQTIFLRGSLLWNWEGAVSINKLALAKYHSSPVHNFLHQRIFSSFFRKNVYQALHYHDSCLACLESFKKDKTLFSRSETKSIRRFQLLSDAREVKFENKHLHRFSGYLLSSMSR